MLGLLSWIYFFLFGVQGLGEQVLHDKSTNVPIFFKLTISYIPFTYTHTLHSIGLRGKSFALSLKVIFCTFISLGLLRIKYHTSPFLPNHQMWFCKFWLVKCKQKCGPFRKGLLKGINEFQREPLFPWLPPATAPQNSKLEPQHLLGTWRDGGSAGVCRKFRM